VETVGEDHCSHTREADWSILKAHSLAEALVCEVVCVEVPESFLIQKVAKVEVDRVISLGIVVTTKNPVFFAKDS